MGNLIGWLLMLAFWLAVFAGWVMNIIHVLAYDFAIPVTVGIVLQIVGIFVFPLGALLGWIL